MFDEVGRQLVEAIVGGDDLVILAEQRLQQCGLIRIELGFLKRIDGMKRLTPPLNVVAYTAPPREDALTGARGGGQPWSMLALIRTRRKARSVC